MPVPQSIGVMRVLSVNYSRAVVSLSPHGTASLTDSPQDRPAIGGSEQTSDEHDSFPFSNWEFKGCRHMYTGEKMCTSF